MPLRMTRRDLASVSAAAAKGMKSIDILIAASGTCSGTRNKMQPLREDLDRVSAVIKYEDDSVGYVRATVSTVSVSELDADPNVEAIELDTPTDDTPLADTSPSTATSADTFPMPSNHTPRANPFLPIEGMRVASFLKEHPTFDGRGVVVAEIDAPPDPFLSELSRANALDGRLHSKILDYVIFPMNAETLRSPDGVLHTARFRAMVYARRGTFTVGGRRFRAPHNGRFELGAIDINDSPSLGSGVLTLRIHSPPKLRSGRFDVLYDRTEKKVWVDANATHDFSEAPGLLDYGRTQGSGLFKFSSYDVLDAGLSDAQTQDLRSPLHYVIKVSSDGRTVAVLMPELMSYHGSMVAGVLAGRGFYGGAFSGVAPGASIVSFFELSAKPGRHQVLEPYIRAEEDRRIDLITDQSATAAGPVFRIIVRRLIGKYGKLIFGALGNNGPDLGSGGDFVGGMPGIIGVGAYASADTMRALYGGAPARRDYVPNYSARGPNVYGGLVPVVIAPADSISVRAPLWPGSYGHFIRGTRLPSKYMVSGGTSSASPMAAGLAADLISASRQSRIRYDAMRLQLALQQGVRRLCCYTPLDQGNGLLDISMAWELLRKLQDFNPAHLEILAFARSRIFDERSVRGESAGLYEREGWTLYDARRRNIFLLRLSGSKADVAYKASWLLNDGTFHGPTTIRVPLRRPVVFPVSIRPRACGLHAALVKFYRARAPVADAEVPMTIVVPESKDCGAIDSSGQVIVMRRIAAYEFSRAFFTVPSRTTRLALSVLGPDWPMAAHYRAADGTSGFLTAQPARSPNKAKWSALIPQPVPGVWEVNVSTRRGAIDARIHRLAQIEFRVQTTPR